MANDQSATVKVTLPKGGERTVYHIKPNDKINLGGLDMGQTRIDLLGADMVLTNTKTGATVVLAQLALYLFSKDDAPEITGANGQVMSPESMLSHVGKVWEFTAKDYLGITSMEKAEKDPQSEDENGGVIKLSDKVDAAAAQVSVAQFNTPAEPKPLTEDTKKFDHMLELPPVVNTGMFSTPPKVSTDKVDVAPDEQDGSGNGITFTFQALVLQAGKTETSLSPSASEIRGGGAFETAVFDDRNAAQFSQEIIDVSAGNKTSYTIYSDNPDYFTDTTAARMLQLTPYLPDGFVPSEIAISGLPGGFSITGATFAGGVWTLTNPTLASDGSILLPIVYPTGSPSSFTLTLDFTATFDASSSSSTPANGEISYTLDRDVEVKAVTIPSDGNYLDGSNKLVWVLAQNENSTKILGGDKTLTVYGGKGVDEVYSGAGNDTVYGGKGDDIISSGGGDDLLQGGDGNDTLIGGNGFDTADYADKTLAVSVDLSVISAGRSTAYVNAVAEDSLEGIENLTGGTGNDTLYGDAGSNRLGGGDGDDILQGRGGNDTLIGGNGVDTVTYAYATNGVTVALSSGSATVVVGAGDTDTLTAIENITGTDYADTLTGDTAVNILSGGLGNDTFYYSGGNDVIDGGGGTDTMYLTAAGTSTSLDLGTLNGGGYATLTVGGVTQTVSSIENVTGSANADTITGDSGVNVLYGMAGNDTLDGGGGDDTIYGGTGSDTLIGGSGTDQVRFDDLTSAVAITLSGTGAGSAVNGANTDTFSGFETVYMTGFDDTLTESTSADIVYGLGGNDTFMAIAGDSANDTFDGGAGTNTINYTNATNAVNLNLATQTATGNGTDTLVNIQNVVGSSGNDTIQGSTVNNSLDGGAGTNTLSYAYTSTGIVANLASVNGGGFATVTIGSDTDLVKNFSIFTGGGGNDTFTGNGTGQTFNGGNGNDTFNYSASADTFNGDAGSDTVVYTGLANAISATLDVSGNSTVTFTGLGKSDTLTAIENITGGSGNDALNGNASANILRGGIGTDTIYGYAGADTLYGDADNDTIYGGDDNDAIYGGDGNDTLYGENGNDTFYGDLGDDTINGGTGTNALDYGAITTVVNISAGTGTASGVDVGTDTFTNIQQFYGGTNNDTFTGTTGNDYFVGNAGSDTITATNGNDTYLTTESLNYSSYSAKITANLTTGTILKDTNNDGTTDYTDTVSAANVSTISTSTYDDIITGNSNNNSISSGSGNDTLYSSLGVDSYNGGAGTDNLYYSNLSGTINVNLTLGNTTKSADGKVDSFSAIERVYANTGNDTFTTNTSAFSSFTTLDGGGGTDTITVSSGTFATNVEAANFASVFDNVEVMDLRNATLSGADSFVMTAADVVGISSTSRNLTVQMATGFNMAVSAGSGYSIASDTTVGNTRTVSFTGTNSATLTILSY